MLPPFLLWDIIRASHCVCIGNFLLPAIYGVCWRMGTRRICRPEAATMRGERHGDNFSEVLRMSRRRVVIVSVCCLSFIDWSSASDQGQGNDNAKVGEKKIGGRRSNDKGAAAWQ